MTAEQAGTPLASGGSSRYAPAAGASARPRQRPEAASRIPSIAGAAGARRAPAGGPPRAPRARAARGRGSGSRCPRARRRARARGSARRPCPRPRGPAPSGSRRSRTTRAARSRAARQQRTTWRAQALAREVCTHDSSCKLLQAHALGARERVLAGEGEVHRVTEQRHARLHAASCSVSCSNSNSSARSSSPARSSGAICSGSPSTRRQLDVRVALAERRDRKRHQRGSGRGEGGHAQAAARAARRSPPERPRRRPAAASMPSAWRTSVWPAAVRRDAARVALEQRHARFGLERRDLLGDRRLRVGQRLRGRRERATVGDLLEDPQAWHVKH